MFKPVKPVQQTIVFISIHFQTRGSLQAQNVKTIFCLHDLFIKQIFSALGKWDVSKHEFKITSGDYSTSKTKHLLFVLWFANFYLLTEDEANFIFLKQGCYIFICLQLEHAESHAQG